MRLKHFDNFIISSMSFVAIGSIYMLYGVKFFPKQSSDQLKVASIVEQIKTVKRKKDFYQSWVDVSPGDSLAQNDEIYTHGQSSAKINFINGPQISLFENSLLRIKSQNKESTLSLDRGNLSAKLSPKSPKLDVVVSGKKYSFESQNASIQIEQGKTENKFILLEGKAKLNVGEKKEEFSSNQVLIQNKKTGDLKIKELPFILKSPPNNSINYFMNQKEINFSWSYTSSPIPVKISIAKDSSFDKILMAESVDLNHFSFKFDQAGTYYWKLSSADDLEGPIRSFTLKEELPPVLILEKNIIYKGPKTIPPLPLRWNLDNAKKYLLKIKSPEGEIQNIKLSKNYYELKDLKIGKYEVTVKIDEINRPEALWSEPSSIEVIEAKSIAITRNDPEVLHKVIYNNQALNHLLSWNGPNSDVVYKIKVTNKKSSKLYETENTSYPLSLKDPGEYLWEVQAQSSSGIYSNILAGKIIIKTPIRVSQTPSEGAVIELEKPDQLVSFKWDRAEKNSVYQFELSSEPDFQKIIYEKEIESNNVSTTMEKTGKYFWRVKIKKGDSIEYSSPVSVEIKPTPPLERPEVSPSIKIKIKYLDEKSSMNSIWDFFMAKAHAADPVSIAEWDLPANPRAKKYIVEIYEDQNLSNLLAKIESSVAHIIWKNAVPGTFYWRVSYEDYWGRKTEFSKVSTLSTELEQPPAPKIVEKILPATVELISPKHKETVLNMIDDEAILSWSSIPNVKNYQVKVASDLEFENLLLNSKISSTQLKINCKDFDEKEGEYFWKISSDSENISKRRMFRAKCTPKKVEEAVVEVSPNLIPEKKNHRYARVGFLPHSLSYDNKALQYSAKVSGTVLNSWYGMYQTPVDWKYFQLLNPTIYISRGKVFNSITFTDLEMNLKAHKIENHFNWGPVLSFMKKTLYIESNLAVTSASQSMPLLGLFIQKNFEHISFNAEAKFGGALDLHVDFLVDLKKNISAGAFFDSTSLTKEGNKHSFSRFGLNLSYTFALLEDAK